MSLEQAEHNSIFQPSLDLHRIMALAELKFIERAEVIHLLGPPDDTMSRPMGPRRMKPITGLPLVLFPRSCIDFLFRQSSSVAGVPGHVRVRGTLGPILSPDRTGPAEFRDPRQDVAVVQLAMIRLTAVGH